MGLTISRPKNQKIIFTTKNNIIFHKNLKYIVLKYNINNKYIKHHNLL